MNQSKLSANRRCIKAEWRCVFHPNMHKSSTSRGLPIIQEYENEFIPSDFFNFAFYFVCAASALAVLLGVNSATPQLWRRLRAIYA
jgi:hypothetical protein